MIDALRKKALATKTGTLTQTHIDNTIEQALKKSSELKKRMHHSKNECLQLSH